MLPDHRAVGEARADDAAERRVVAGAAADHDGDLARRLGGADHTAGHAHHPVAVASRKPSSRSSVKAAGSSVKPRHEDPPHHLFNRIARTCSNISYEINNVKCLSFITSHVIVSSMAARTIGRTIQQRRGYGDSAARQSRGERFRRRAGAQGISLDLQPGT